MVGFTKIGELRELLEEGDGLQVVTLQELRESLGYKKLGPIVLNSVSEKLAGQGIGYFPDWIINANDLPRGRQEVRVFLKDSALGRIVQSVIEPTDTGDQRLLDLVEEDSPAEKLEQIRAVLES